jgi:D-alanine-D-alanine ligase
MAHRTRVLVLFGGRSSEHGVSVLSARNVAAALDPSRYEVVPVGIGQDGVWRYEPAETLAHAAGDPRKLQVAGTGRPLRVPAGPPGPDDDIRPDDVLFPVLHGTFGEDGTIQGLFELMDVAYVGCGPLGASIGMDKDVAKKLLAFAKLPVVPWHTVTAHAWATDRAATRASAAALGLPLFVKPANAGSSVGVHKVQQIEDLDAALEDALRFDGKVLVEPGLDIREIECAVLGNDAPEAATPGEIVVHHADGFYSYEAKYVDASGSHPEIPANAPAALLETLRALAVQTFRALELSGLARVDFFVERGTDRVFINEVNTLPGFTPISMYPKMWEAAGVSNPDLVDRLVQLAKERHALRRARITAQPLA